LEKINVTPCIETMYFLIQCKIFVMYHKQSYRQYVQWCWRQCL